MLILLALIAHGAETLALHDPQRITLSGTPNVATQVICPAGTRTIWVQFETNAGKLDFTGTDGAAIDSTDYIVMAADTLYELRHPGADWGKQHARDTVSVYLASATASTVVGVTCYQAGD